MTSAQPRDWFEICFSREPTAAQEQTQASWHPQDESLWVLCVVDDDSGITQDAWQELGAHATPEARDRYVKAVADQGSSVSNVGAMVNLPYYCAKLNALDRLVIGDFPRNGRASIIEYVLQQQPEFQVAFLVDRFDDKGNDDNSRIDGAQVLKDIVNLGVSPDVCNELSRSPDDRLGLVKPSLVQDDGGELVVWWKGLRRVITAKLFQTACRDGLIPHDPGAITQQTLDDRTFSSFLRKQSARDSYNVWNWILESFPAKGSPLDAFRYAYLCGKAFLHSGLPDASGAGNAATPPPAPASPPRTTFFLTALRGLAWGCRFSWLAERKRRGKPRVEVSVDDDAFPVPEDINNTKVYGTITTGKEPFQTFSYRLSLWLTTLASGHNAEETLNRIRLVRLDGECRLLLHFSGTLTANAFCERTDRGVIGLVYDRWLDVLACFDPGLQPFSENNHQSAVFRFRYVDEPAQATDSSRREAQAPLAAAPRLTYALFDSQNETDDPRDLRACLERLQFDRNQDDPASCDVLVAHANTDAPDPSKPLSPRNSHLTIAMVQQVLARGGVYVKYTTGYPVWRMESPGSFYGSSSELLARLNTLPVPLQHLRQVHQCLEAQRDTPTLLALLLLCEAYLALRLAPDTGKADNAEPALAGVVEQLGWAFSDDEIGSVPASLRDTQTRAEVAGRHPLLPPGFVSTHPTLAQDVHREWGSADAGQVKIVLDLLSDTPTLQQVALAYSALRKRLPK